LKQYFCFEKSPVNNPKKREMIKMKIKIKIKKMMRNNVNNDEAR
jgi:hypothetical protein